MQNLKFHIVKEIRKMNKKQKFNIGDTVTANIYGKIGIGKVLECELDSITKLYQYYVAFEFANNCYSKVWIYEGNLDKIN